MNSRHWLFLFVLAFSVRLLALGLEWSSPNYIGVGIQNAEATRHLAQGDGYAFDRSRVAAIYEEQTERGGLTDLRHFPLSRYPERRVQPVFQYPPGYAIFLWLFGGWKTFVFARLFQVVLDSLACLWLTGLALRMLGLRAAWVAGFVYAMWLPSAISSATATPDAMTPFFTIGALDFFIRGINARGRRAWWFWALSGLWVGLGGYLRPTFLLLGLAMGGMGFVFSRFSWRPLVAGALVFGVTMLVLVPWAWRNHRLADRWMFTSSIGGYAFWEGLGDFPNPWGIEASDKMAQEFVEAHGYEWHSPESDRFLKSEFWKNVKAHPAAYASQVFRRCLKVVTARSYYGFGWRVQFDPPMPGSLRELPGWLFHHAGSIAILVLWRGWNILELALVALAVGGLFSGNWPGGHYFYKFKAPVFGVIVYIASLSAFIHFHPRYLVTIIPCYILLGAPAGLRLYDAAREKLLSRWTPSRPEGV
ncbi:MAG: glycosyltransferase family 39 protein [Acidobacteriota bacterium]|nr:MAG: glycosyltransferase family 39 protein [Acidobacteriota bacterium]